MMQTPLPGPFTGVKFRELPGCCSPGELCMQCSKWHSLLQGLKPVGAPCPGSSVGSRSVQECIQLTCARLCTSVPRWGLPPGTEPQDRSSAPSFGTVSRRNPSVPDPQGVLFFLQGEPCFTASLGWTSGPAASLLHPVSSAQRVPLRWGPRGTCLILGSDAGTLAEQGVQWGLLGDWNTAEDVLG